MRCRHCGAKADSIAIPVCKRSPAFPRLTIRVSGFSLRGVPSFADQPCITNYRIYDDRVGETTRFTHRPDVALSFERRIVSIPISSAVWNETFGSRYSQVYGRE
jgi:hypothetical protein